VKPQKLWQAVLAELQLSLSPSNFSLCFGQTKGLSLKKEGKRLILEVSVPNPYIRNTIFERYLGQIQQAVKRISGKKNEIVFTVLPSASASKKPAGPLFEAAEEEEKKDTLKEAVLKARLRLDFTFENFAVSPTNEVAYAAAAAVSKNPGDTYNPLFLYGGVGVGKTHLMQGVAHNILKDKPDYPLIYSMSEEFTNEIVEAIRHKTTADFRKKHRSVQALLIDDVQFVAGKDAVQEELFHTFNALQRSGGQVVLTADKPPHEIELLEDRLRSRFEGGLTIDIQEPNFELRTAILLIKAKQLKKDLPMDIAQLIAGNISSTRRLEGFLIKLFARAETRKERISPEMAQALLGKNTDQPAEVKRIVRPKEVVDAVARHFKMKLDELRGPRRQQRIVLPRQLAMYILRMDLKASFQEIGMMFGGRDHTTVMYSVEKISHELGDSAELRLELSAVRKKLYG